MCLLLVAFGCDRALAYLTATTGMNAVAVVGTLSAPTITSATAGAGTVALSWSSVPAPAGGTVSYYVTRVGGSVGGDCPTSSATTTSTSCTDSGLTRGTYSYTVTAVWQSWASTSTTSAVSVSSAALDHFGVTTPATVTAGASFTATVTAQDAANNTVIAYNGAQTVTFSNPANAPNGAGPVYPGSVSFTNGVGTAGITLYDAQSTTLTATTGSVTGTSSAFTVAAGANHHIAASASSPQIAGAAFNVTLTAQDTWGNATGTLSGSKSVTFSGPSASPNSSAPVYPATASFAGGVATASVTLKDAQTTSISATDTTDSLPAVASAGIVVNPASANSFNLTTPGAQTAGTAFNESIAALDTYGNTATGYAGSKTITFSGPVSAPGGTGPSYPASVSFASGIGIASVTLYDAQTTTLTATQASVTGTSGSFAVAVGANHQIAASASSPQVAGTAFNVTLTVQDSWGNPTGSTTGTKSVSFSGPANSPNSTAPAYPTTASFTNGVATVSVTLKDAQTTTITATDTTDSYTGVASGAVVVNAASASAFSVPTPSAPTAGTPFNETLTALDTYGNTATTYAGSKTITFSGPANAPGGSAPVYPASVTFTAGAGTASITLKDAQSTTLTATQGTITGTSGSFAVQGAAASQLVYTTQPGGAIAGASFTTQPVVTAKDTYGNVAGGYSATVSLSIASGTGTLSHCSSSLSNGATTFSGCQVSASGTYTLKASDGTLNVTSASFIATGNSTVSDATAGTDTLTVPAGVTSFTFTMNGAGGGGGASGAAGGAGGTVSGTITIPWSATSTTFTVIVGGKGGGTTTTAAGAAGTGGTGCAAGGAGGTGTIDGGGGGGGSTCIYLSGAPAGTIVTVGGGGGGAGGYAATGGAGAGGPGANPGTSTANNGTSAPSNTGGSGGQTLTSGSFPFGITNTGGARGTGTRSGTAGGTCSAGTCGAGGAGAGALTAFGAGGGGGGMASGGGGAAGNVGATKYAAGGGGGSAYTGGAQSGGNDYTVSGITASNGGGSAGGAASTSGADGTVSFTGPGLTLV